MPTDTAKVSVAMATYNGARYLRQQLDSLAAQTLLPAELVATDDGSSDTTLEILAAFAQAAPFPVRVVRNQPRLGYADNFFRAASLCTSPLIAFCDQDDLWLPNRLETIVPFFQDPAMMLACHTAALWNGEQLTGEFFPHFHETRIHESVSLDPFSLFPGFSIIFRAEILTYVSSDIRPRHVLNLGSHEAPEPMAHDNWVTFLATSIGRVVTIAEPLAQYRQHDKNTKGAPKVADTRSRFQWALGMTGYAEQAKHWALCASVVDHVSGQVPARFRKNVEKTRDNFKTRSRFHFLRSVIYSPESNLFQRSSSFLKLLFGGAYGNDTTRTRLGPRAAIKDVCFGLPALARLTKSRGTSDSPAS